MPSIIILIGSHAQRNKHSRQRFSNYVPLRTFKQTQITMKTFFTAENGMVILVLIGLILC